MLCHLAFKVVQSYVIIWIKILEHGDLWVYIKAPAHIVNCKQNKIIIIKLLDIQIHGLIHFFPKGQGQWNSVVQQPVIHSTNTPWCCPEWGSEVGVTVDPYQKHSSKENIGARQNQNVSFRNTRLGVWQTQDHLDAVTYQQLFSAETFFLIISHISIKKNKALNLNNIHSFYIFFSMENVS